MPFGTRSPGKEQAVPLKWTQNGASPRVEEVHLQRDDPAREGQRGWDNRVLCFPLKSSHPVLPHPLCSTPPTRTQATTGAGPILQTGEREGGHLTPSEIIPTAHPGDVLTLRGLQSDCGGEGRSSCKSLSDGEEPGFTLRNPILIGM